MRYSLLLEGQHSLTYLPNQHFYLSRRKGLLGQCPFVDLLREVPPGVLP